MGNVKVIRDIITNKKIIEQILRDDEKLLYCLKVD